ncbi:MAG: 4-alpha-glucanotransferase [Pseudomonadota bacterium]
MPKGIPWELTLEDGRQLEGGAALEALPFGLHELSIAGSSTDRSILISCPKQLPLPSRAWGVMLPLHALRSPRLGGLATTKDLTQAAEGFAQLGASFVGLNPIHAGFWGDASGYSPYMPSHRRRLSSFFIPSNDDHGPTGDLLDYSVEVPRRRQALEAAYAAFDGDEDFTAFKSHEGEPLHRFALHQALSDQHGPFWTSWPSELQEPAGQAARGASEELAPEVDFHCWLQWKAEDALRDAQRSMQTAGMATGLFLDLAVGTHPAGAETWEDRDTFAYGVSLGAPPDAFAADGQAWGLAPFNPISLIVKSFRPLAETLERQFRFAGALRIDHILGFDRTFWVPESGEPGAYVRMPRDAMLAVARLAAARAGAFIVGEDLGNVPRGLRPALEAAGLLGCQLQLFERDRSDRSAFKRPDDFPERSMASFSTHDLPTWMGWRQSHDIRSHQRLGHIDEVEAAAACEERRQDVTAFDAMTSAHMAGTVDVANVDTMHSALASTRSALVLLQIENLLEITPQPNLPGTSTQYPNWRQRLPEPPAALAHHNGVRRAASIMARSGR